MEFEKTRPVFSVCITDLWTHKNEGVQPHDEKRGKLIKSNLEEVFEDID